MKPRAPAVEDLLLHVMFTDEPQEAKIIRAGGEVGVSFGDVKVTFEGDAGGCVTIGDKRFPLERKVKTGRFE